DIELKVPGLESCVLDAISKHPPQKGFVVSSFLPQALLDFRRSTESVPLGIICEARSQLDRWPELPVDYVMAKEFLVSQDLPRAVHEAGKKLLVWTINRTGSMLRLAEWKVDGIISDKPDLLVSTLRES